MSFLPTVTIEVFNGPTLTLTRDTYEVGYALSPQHGGNFVVTLIGTSQRIVCLPPFFRKTANVSDRATAGRFDADLALLDQLGFTAHRTGVHPYGYADPLPIAQ